MTILFSIQFLIVSLWLFVLARKDWTTRTLPNAWTMGGAAVVLIWRLGWGGGSFLLNGIAGGIAAALLLFIPFLLRAAGAGDIKFLFAIGALVGIPRIFGVLFLICITGIVLAIVMILTGKMNGARMKHLLHCVFDVHYDWKKGRENLPSKESEQVRIPFGVAIAFGTFLSFGLQLYKGVLK